MKNKYHLVGGVATSAGEVAIRIGALKDGGRARWAQPEGIFRYELGGKRTDLPHLKRLLVDHFLEVEKEQDQRSSKEALLDFCRGQPLQFWKEAVIELLHSGTEEDIGICAVVLDRVCEGLRSQR